MKLKNSVLWGEADEYMVPRDDCPTKPACNTRYAEWVNGWKNLQPERPSACPACEAAGLAERFVRAAQRQVGGGAVREEPFDSRLSPDMLLPKGERR